MIIVYVLGIIVGLLVIALVKALLLKPTSAKEAKVTLDTSIRAEEYGKQLAKMIQCETISSRSETDKTKFLEFHKTLEELFPNVHKNCEKHVFDGSLLYKWTGKSDKEPILLMSHQDVVEANGTWEHEPFGGRLYCTVSQQARNRKSQGYGHKDQ